MKALKLIPVIFCFLGFGYFFFSSYFPLEITYLKFRQALILLFILSSYIWLIIKGWKTVATGKTKYWINLLMIFIVVLHHSLLGLYNLLLMDHYKDVDIIDINPNDAKHRKIQQIAEYGFDSDVKIIECYELFPGLRYILNKNEN